MYNSPMKIYLYSLPNLLISLLCAESQTAEDILLKTFHRMDGINHSFIIDSKESGKTKKEKFFKIFIHWPSEGNILNQTRVISIDSKRKNPSSFWVQQFRDGSKTKKWMSMPITGKLKDVSDKKSRKKEFSFSDLRMTDKEIKTYENELLPQGKVDTLLAYVIHSIDRDNNGIVKKSKKIWVGIDNYMIMKVEFYTGSGRLYRSITCSDFHFVEEILFPMSIFIQDLKSKTDAEITIKDIEINPSFDMDIFIPSNQ
ncbi:uncharacterized protein METZ01_LOCUS222803, partial [marine metagenome]